MTSEVKLNVYVNWFIQEASQFERRQYLANVRLDLRAAASASAVRLEELPAVPLLTVHQQPLFLLMNKTSEPRWFDSYFCWLRCEAAPGAALACLLTERLACLSRVIGAVHQRAHKSNETLKKFVLPAGRPSIPSRPSITACSDETRSPAHNGPRKLIRLSFPPLAAH